MNLPMDKINSLINAVKGKKPVIIIISVLALAAGVFAVSKGYIPESMLDVNSIVTYVEGIFSESTKAVDTVATQVIIDTLNNPGIQ
jgi:hypothetical protein